MRVQGRRRDAVSRSRRTRIEWAGLAVALAACDAPVPAALGTAAQPIRNGTRQPEAVALTEGQQMAIGWLHLAGDPLTNFCTGTLIGQRLVATARHCTDDYTAREVAFGVGLQPAEPVATFGVVEIHEHPTADAALLILADDATAVVPGLTPIAANAADLDGAAGQGLVGRDVQVAGYGDTFDVAATGRFFATVRLVNVTPEYVVVDGQGRQGLCFGDSGGPVITPDATGRAVVLGVEHAGDPSCVGVDQLTRLDAVNDWLAPVAARAGVSEPCGEVDYQGRCVGDLAQWCDGGRLAQVDCGVEGRTCGFVNEEVGFYCKVRDLCGGVTVSGVCQGDVAVRCQGGRLVEEDCAARAGVCRVGAVGARCGPPLLPMRPDPAPEPAGDDGDGGVHFHGGCRAAPGPAAPVLLLALAGLGAARGGRRRRRRPLTEAQHRPHPGHAPGDGGGHPLLAAPPLVHAHVHPHGGAVHAAAHPARDLHAHVQHAEAVEEAGPLDPHGGQRHLVQRQAALGAAHAEGLAEAGGEVVVERRGRADLPPDRLQRYAGAAALGGRHLQVAAVALDEDVRARAGEEQRHASGQQGHEDHDSGGAPGPHRLRLSVR